MAQRINATDLARLLHSAKHPIYVLDDDFTIVFLNSACHDWLGAAAEGLLGRTCVYHSSEANTGPDAVAAALCPPPQVLAGEILIATVAPPVEDGAPVERRAKFLPLGIADDVTAIIVIVFDAGTNVDEVTVVADSAVALHDLVRRFHCEAAARHRIDALIGQGPAMQLARRQLELAVASRSSVSLVGPPGSGRRHLAAALHYASGESGLLTPLDCALLGEDLLETATAFFAHGAATLVLHRVDELAADIQARLAELLKRKPASMRLVATSASLLVDLARHGAFQLDLASLLSTVTIELPPLEQRREDLPLLAQAFLEERNAAGSRQIGGFSQAALDRLDGYAWPGNLGELAEVVAEAHRNAGGTEIGVNDLPERLHAAAQAAAMPRRVDETIVLDEYLARVERELIRRALARAKGNRAKAARLLGITRPRLYRRMAELGLE